jgi:heat shock protein HslJ
MKQSPILLLICGIIVSVLFAGCTAPQGMIPSTDTPITSVPTTLVMTDSETGSPLLGKWTLISALAGMGTTNVIPGTTIITTFSEDGTVSGSAGCNNFVASYQSREDTLTTGTLTTTLKSCNSPAGVMNQEQIFLTNLKGVDTFTTTSDILAISDANGKTLLTFRKEGAPVSPLPFAGIEWRLETYKGSGGSMIGINPATTVSALFGTEGSISGSAGCNSYTGSYTHSGQNGISIGPLATTRMYCGEPGLMDQETACLANLQAAASYQVTSDGKLHLMDASGTPVLVYSG